MASTFISKTKPPIAKESPPVSPAEESAFDETSEQPQTEADRRTTTKQPTSGKATKEPIGKSVMPKTIRQYEKIIKTKETPKTVSTKKMVTTVAKKKMATIATKKTPENTLVGTRMIPRSQVMTFLPAETQVKQSKTLSLLPVIDKNTVGRKLPEGTLRTQYEVASRRPKDPNMTDYKSLTPDQRLFLDALPVMPTADGTVTRPSNLKPPVRERLEDQKDYLDGGTTDDRTFINKEAVQDGDSEPKVVQENVKVAVGVKKEVKTVPHDYEAIAPPPKAVTDEHYIKINNPPSEEDDKITKPEIIVTEEAYRGASKAGKWNKCIKRTIITFVVLVLLVAVSVGIAFGVVPLFITETTVAPSSSMFFSYL